MMAYIPQKELDRVRREILKDIGDEVLKKVKEKCKKEAYDTGRLYNSIELEMTTDGFIVGSHEPHSLYADNKKRIFAPDKNVERGIDNALI